MKYITEYRNKELAQKIVNEINKISTKPVSIMEVCGGHTHAIHKYGIPSMLPESVKLLSGPGCPVCVTSREFIDKAVEYSKEEKNIIATYGDLIRVPGSISSLEKQKSEGAMIEVIQSTIEALKIARDNPLKNVIFLGIGFETTSPSTAVAVKEAANQGIKNFFVLSSHKTMPSAMRAIINEGVKIEGYIAPGHVSAITGSKIYYFIPDEFRLSVVVSGFEPIDILLSILMVIKQFESDNPKVEIQYRRAVTYEGNLKAQSIVKEVFDAGDDWWRGVGIIPESGLKLNEKYKSFDAGVALPVQVEQFTEPKGCICGEILKGLKQPVDCALFSKVCTPLNPVGACMVSNEGACQAYFKYRIR